MAVLLTQICFFFASLIYLILHASEVFLKVIFKRMKGELQVEEDEAVFKS